MTKEELWKEAEEIYTKTDKEFMDCQDEGEIFNLGYLASAEPREKEIKSLGERCLQLQKDKGNLTDRVRELEQQIEKMKCWCNCKSYLSCLEECCRKNISFEKGICYNCKKWELRR